MAINVNSVSCSAKATFQKFAVAGLVLVVGADGYDMKNRTVRMTRKQVRQLYGVPPPISKPALDKASVEHGKKGFVGFQGLRDVMNESNRSRKLPKIQQKLKADCSSIAYNFRGCAYNQNDQVARAKKEKKKYYAELQKIRDIRDREIEITNRKMEVQREKQNFIWRNNKMELCTQNVHRQAGQPVNCLQQQVPAVCDKLDEQLNQVRHMLIRRKERRDFQKVERDAYKKILIEQRNAREQEMQLLRSNLKKRSEDLKQELKKMTKNSTYPRKFKITLKVKRNCINNLIKGAKPMDSGLRLKQDFTNAPSQVSTKFTSRRSTPRNNY